jgi:hypothetical protein
MGSRSRMHFADCQAETLQAAKPYLVMPKPSENKG